MGKLIYLMNVSLDGFFETPDRDLDWTTVDASPTYRRRSRLGLRRLAARKAVMYSSRRRSNPAKMPRLLSGHWDIGEADEAWLKNQNPQ